MPIIYSVIARGPVILAEYASSRGNFDQVAKRILEKIPNSDSKMSYVYERHIFHYSVNDQITFLCMADEEFGRRIPFAYLEDLKNRFQSTYHDRAKNAIANSLNEDFSKVMQNLMAYYSNSKNSDNITRLKGEVDEVKQVMVQNIERVLERGERIELLVDKTDNLSSSAFKFKKSSTQLKRSMWLKNVKLMAVIFFIALILIYIIVAASCGGPALKNCRK